MSLHGGGGEPKTQTTYQTLTPVPPMPAITGGHYGQPMPYGHAAYPQHHHGYGFHPPPPPPPHQQPHLVGYPAVVGEPTTKIMKVSPDSTGVQQQQPSSHTDSFQVPHVSSTVPRPGLAGPGPPQQQPPQQHHHQQHQQQQHPHHQQQHPPQLINPPQPSQHGMPPPHHGLAHHAAMQPGHGPPPVDVAAWVSDQAAQAAHLAPAGSVASMSPSGESNAASDKPTKKKRKRCGECPGCLKKDNCGECGPCKSVRSHQICKMRKCDQLKTKKEKVREAAQLAAAQAAAAAAGLPPPTSINELKTKEGMITGNGGLSRDSSSGSPTRAPTMNGSASYPVHEGHRTVRAYQDFNKPPPPPNGLLFDSAQQAPPGQPVNAPGPFGTAYAGHHVTQPYGNGHHPGGHGPPNGNGNEHHGPARPGGDEHNDPANRHQMTNSRLKSLIQNRQNSKAGTQPGSVSEYSPGSQAKLEPNYSNQTSYNGQAAHGQQQSANNNLSPHYVYKSDNESFGQMPNWNVAGDEQQLVRTNGTHENGQPENGGTKPPNGIPPGYQQQAGNYVGYDQSPQQRPASNGHANYSTNNANYEQSAPGQSPAPLRPQSQSSADFNRASPARSKSVDPAGAALTRSSPAVESATAVSGGDQPAPQPFLSNTTTSMNTYTNITSSYNAQQQQQQTSPTAASPSLTQYNNNHSPSYLLPLSSGPTSPFFGGFTPQPPQTVIMASVDSTTPRAGDVNGMVGMDCGRGLDSLDSTSLLDLNSPYHLLKSSDVQPPTHHTNASITDAMLDNNHLQTNTALPPVSTFLLPSFRDGWWPLKSSFDATDPNGGQQTDEQREYSITSLSG